MNRCGTLDNLIFYIIIPWHGYTWVIFVKIYDMEYVVTHICQEFLICSDLC